MRIDMHVHSYDKSHIFTQTNNMKCQDKSSTIKMKLTYRRSILLMQINPIKLMHKNEFITHYRNEQEAVIDYFDHLPFNDDKKRLTYIHNRQFNRQKLIDILNIMNEKWNAPKQTFQQIERLHDENSVVVIGGQQAGLVTGPLYTVNKIISIIQLARQKEAQLNIPVIPVFWIAGEDHDYDEINHVHIDDGAMIRKLTTKQQALIKKSVSHIELTDDTTKSWLNDLFLSLQETEHTKSLYESLQSILNNSKTFVDFFARFIFYLFQEEGIVLFDSGDKVVREIESEFFIDLIENQEKFAQSVVTQVESLRQAGHPVLIDAELEDSHLFFHDEANERILLKRLGKDWAGKNDEVQLSTDEILTIAKENPERLSNNVISRPLMQEYLFPTLAFVAGDGEISYWATLKKAFHLFDLRMPPVVPRLSFTFVNRKTKTLLAERMIPIDSVINEGVKTRKLNWLQSQQTPPIPTVVEEVKRELASVHEPLRQVAGSMSENIHQLAEQNLLIINREIDYLQNKMTNELKRQHKLEIEKYDFIDKMLHPNGVLQERIWNPIPFINEYGKQFITDLVNRDCQFENEHYAVYL